METRRICLLQLWCTLIQLSYRMARPSGLFITTAIHFKEPWPQRKTSHSKHTDLQLALQVHRITFVKIWKAKDWTPKIYSTQRRRIPDVVQCKITDLLLQAIRILCCFKIVDYMKFVFIQRRLLLHSSECVYVCVCELSFLKWIQLGHTQLSFLPNMFVAQLTGLHIKGNLPSTSFT